MYDESRLIAIFGTKGGVGKTVIATNLAVSLAKRTRKKVALVDLDLQFGGDMAKMLDLTPSKTLIDAITRLNKSDKGPFPIKDFVTSHTSGVDFIPAIPRPKFSHLINTKSLENLFNIFRQNYAYTIIDAGNSFSEHLITAFDNANLILLVLTPDIISVYQTKWNIEVIESLHFPLNMIKIILNRSESKGAVDPKEVRAVFPCEIIAHIPSEGKVVGPSINQGTPFVISYERSKVAIAVNNLADALASDSKVYMPQQRTLRPKLAEVPTKEKTFWEEFGFAEHYTREEVTQEDEIVDLKRRVHDQFIEELDLKRLDLAELSTDPNKAKEIRTKTEEIVSRILAEQAGGIITSYEVRKRLVKEIADEALGLGPLEDLIKDPTVSDILVNNKDQIYVERHGKLELTNKKFISNEQIRIVIERIIAPLGRRIDESVPMVDARLPDGSRVNAIIPPLSLGGPMISIRKFARERYTADDLMGFGTISGDMIKFLKACVASRKNMIVSGGTGSGKTTLLNILSQYIPSVERIVTIEDSAELRLRQEHWGRLEARMPNIEGKGAITVRDLFRNCLRMRPDRIIVGECRGNESLDMLQAMNTGHDGSLTTIHANSTHDVVSRLDSMILMSGVELPVRAIREMVASAIHVLVHTARLSDGSRKVMCITEVVGLDPQSNVKMKDIYVFKQTGLTKEGKVQGEFRFTGYLPSFLDDLKMFGLELPSEFTSK